MSTLLSALNNGDLPLYLQNWELTQKKLAEPFNPDDVEFIPQLVDWKAKTAIAAAYADSRAYTTRLNETIGLGFWRSEIKSPIITEYNKIIKERTDWKTKAIIPGSEVKGFKLGLIATVSIWMGPVLGWVSQDSTGGKETDDENWTTTAEAQAYKRAISKWGPGQYFYSFGILSYPYDKKWLVQPVLPEWAYPTKYCSACENEITSITYDVGEQRVTKTGWDIYKLTKEMHGQPLCIKCHKEKKTSSDNPDVTKRLK